jgi:hypothetical protein
MSDSTLYTEHHGLLILDRTEERLQDAVNCIRTDPHWQANIKSSRHGQRMQGCVGGFASKIRCKDP